MGASHNALEITFGFQGAEASPRAIILPHEEASEMLALHFAAREKRQYFC
jgi:hypothetical protein